MSLFDGLYVYEVVLLMLGALFFVALATALVAQIIRGKAYIGLSLFFAIPIAMIGFPSIQKIQFQDGTVSIEKSTQQLQADPTNAALRADLQKQVTDLANRPSADPQAITRVARAQFALGNHAAAERMLQKALRTSPSMPQAVELRTRIRLDHELTALTAELAQHPNNAATRAKLEEAVTQAAGLTTASPQLLTHLARAKAALGDQTKAVELAETALKINPNLAEAKQVKSLAAGQR